MKLCDILEDVNARMPHGFEENRIIMWLNTALREIYKVISLREGIRFPATGQMLYPMPSAVQCDLISAITVDGRALTKKRMDEDACPGSWFKVTEGFIGIYPPPGRGKTISVWYFKKPERILTAAEAMDAGISYPDQEIDLDEDYGEMLRLALLITIAEAREDIALANNYKLSYNMLLQRARQERYEKDGKYPVTKDVRGGKR